MSIWSVLVWACLCVLVCDYKLVYFILCVVLSICVLSVSTLTLVARFMCVCLVCSVSGLCPLGRPCVARFWCNRFWQLCNFCWFIPDLGKLFLCGAGVFVRHLHTHTHILYIHLYLFSYMPTCSHLNPHHHPSTHILIYTCTHLVLIDFNSGTGK